jgi:hypothetical protein
MAYHNMVDLWAKIMDSLLLRKGFVMQMLVFEGGGL